MTIYLENHVRIWVFCRAYNNCSSLGQLAKDLGYNGKGRNGTVRVMWTGESGIPEKKFDQLCKLAKVSKEKMMNHTIPKEKSLKIDDWVTTINLFNKSKKPTPEIFLDLN